MDIFSQKPDTIIESAISRLFFYGETVYKVYKHEQFFLGDFTDPDFRRAFIEEDFDWNREMSPDIYLELREENDDLVIVMRKVDTTNSMTDLLLRDALTPDDLRNMTTVMTERIRALTEKKQSKVQRLGSIGYRTLLGQGFEDLRQWAYTADPQLPKKETDRIIDATLAAMRKEPYFDSFDPNALSLFLDNHSDNILFLDGKPVFLDIVPPKEEWHVADPYGNVVRPAIDVAVLHSDALAEHLYAAYEAMMPSVPRRVRTIYEIRSAMVRAPYYFVTLKKPDIAKKYLSFVQRKVAELVRG